jgi:ABC-2 type transport system ATP-binding protein
LGLDIQTRATMWEHLRKLKKEHNMTVFMTTHYLEEADNLCDRIGIIDRGRIMALDSPATLKRSLGGDVIQMSIDGADYTTAIQKVPGILEVKREGSEYRVKVLKGDTAMPAVLKAINDAGGTVSSVTLQRPNMDQVFLEYTGRSLRDAEQTESSDMGKRFARARAAQRRR